MGRYFTHGAQARRRFSPWIALQNWPSEARCAVGCGGKMRGLIRQASRKFGRYYGRFSQSVGVAENG